MTTSFYIRNIEPTMLQRNQKTLNFEVKSLGDGIFAGYASVFNVLDAQSDIIQMGAFKHTIAGRANEIKLLWQHDMREPIGIIEELREDTNGLYLKARLLIHEVARAAEAYALIKSGIVKGLSIGYSPTRYRYDEKAKIRYISQVDLWEISLVTFPANEAAQITVIKSEALPNCASKQDCATLMQSNLLQALDRAIASLSV